MVDSKTSRQEILQRISAASKKRLNFVETTFVDNAVIYKPIFPDQVTCFKAELEAVSGQCILCEDESDLYAQVKTFLTARNLQEVYCRDAYIANQLVLNAIPTTNKEDAFEQMQVGITGCEFLVARTGSVLVSSNSPSGRQMNVFPPIHIVLAHVSQLFNYLDEALDALHQKYDTELPSLISTITGPSRTADIEKTLVLGAHGPKEFVVFLSKV